MTRRLQTHADFLIWDPNTGRLYESGELHAAMNGRVLQYSLPRTRQKKAAKRSRVVAKAVR
jgi:hypothetical protein